MKTGWKWLTDNESEYTWRFVLKVVVRVAILLLVFNLLYLLVRPLESGKPTLYNGPVPGRLRMAWRDVGEHPPLTNEVKLPRLLADHVISRPKQPDEYRVIVLGGSQTWGYLSRAEDTMPLVLDSMGLTTPDGRRVRSYNLAYVWAHGFKDLLIMHYVLAHTDFQPDLVIVVATHLSFDPLRDPHWLVTDNPELAVEVAEKYGLTQLNLEQAYAEVNRAPWWQRHNFFSERDDLAYWFTNQLYGLAWTTTGIDQNIPDEIPRKTKYGGPVGWHLRQPGVFEAFVEMADDYQVELLFLSPPVNERSQYYEAWLAKQSLDLGVPILACSDLLPPTEFTNTNLHITDYGHRLLAEQVAMRLQALWQDPDGSPFAACPPYDAAKPAAIVGAD